MSEEGYCSRREADKYIDQRRVTINGVDAEKGSKVFPGDEVVVDGERISKPSAKARTDFIYLALNKPKGIVCTTDSNSEKDNIIDFINHPKRIFPVGRLDKLSTGLIFLTNDGDIVNKILRAGNKHEKEYMVSVNKPVTADFLKKMSNGVPVNGIVTRKCKLTQVGKTSFKIVLTQGLNRQIRKMCQYLDYEVRSLKRIRIMNVKMDIPEGSWRYLTKEEVSEIKQMVSKSRKTAKPKKPKKSGKNLK